MILSLASPSREPPKIEGIDPHVLRFLERGQQGMVLVKNSNGGRLYRSSSLAAPLPKRRLLVTLPKSKSLMCVHSWDFDESQYLVKSKSKIVGIVRNSPRHAQLDDTDRQRERQERIRVNNLALLRASFEAQSTPARAGETDSIRTRMRSRSTEGPDLAHAGRMAEAACEDDGLRGSSSTDRNIISHDSVAGVGVGGSGGGIAGVVGDDHLHHHHRAHTAVQQKSAPRPCSGRFIYEEKEPKQLAGITVDGVFEMIEKSESLTFVVSFLQVYRYWFRPSELLARLFHAFRSCTGHSTSAPLENQMAWRLLKAIQVWTDSPHFPAALVPNLRVFLRDKTVQYQAIWTQLIMNRITDLTETEVEQIPELRGLPLGTLAFIIKTASRFDKYRKGNDYAISEALLNDFLIEEFRLCNPTHREKLIAALVSFSHISVVAPSSPLSGVTASGSGGVMASSLLGSGLILSSSSSSSSSPPPAFYWTRPSKIVRHSYPKLLYRKTLPNPCDFSLLDAPPQEIARQITLLDQWYFRRLSNSDFTRVSKSKSKPVLEFIEWSNKLASWASFEVVGTGNVKKRLATLKHLIQLCEEFLSLHNFSSFVSVVQGLSHSSVTRLGQTWQQLPKKYQNVHKSHCDLGSVINNFKALRDEQAKSPKPMMPYFAIFLRDVTLLELSNADQLIDAPAYINWPKFEMIAEHFTKTTECQSSFHRFLPNRTIQDFLLNFEKVTNDKLHQLSRLIQPSADIQ